MTLEEAIKMGIDIVNRHLSTDYPDDEWVRLSDEWDLNMYRFVEEQTYFAVIYPVVNGSTITTEWYVVLL